MSYDTRFLIATNVLECGCKSKARSIQKWFMNCIHGFIRTCFDFIIGLIIETFLIKIIACTFNQILKNIVCS